MIVSWGWLKDYVDLDMSVESLVDRLMMAGLNHESTSEVHGDFAIDLEVTSNRPDCLGHIGIAREVAALYGKELRLPKPEVPESDKVVEEWTRVEIQDGAESWCPQYRARLIEGVKIGPSPAWLVRRLAALGLSSVNNVVDVTNYVMMECGQPLHAFDFDRLAEGRIVVRPARSGETFVAINGKNYSMREGMGLIADGSDGVAIAGVMGGKSSEVGPTTTRILLESAEFEPLQVRRTSRSLDLMSDSSYRFERKVDPAGVAWASDRACQLICELAGGVAAKGAIHVGAASHDAEPIRMRWNQVRRILGIDVSGGRCREILSSLGLSVVKDDADGLEVIAPSFRRDLSREIDLVEEVGRIHGYGEVPQDRAIPLRVAPISRERRVWSRIRDVLLGSGFHEAVTFSFVDENSLGLVRPWTAAEPMALQHSSRKQENRLRQSLVPSLLEAVRFNEAHGNEGVRLFETATVFLPRGSEELPDEPRALGLVAMGEIRSLRGVIESIFSRLRIAPRFGVSSIPGFAAGQGGEYLLGERRIAVLGVLDEPVHKALDLRTMVVAGEVLLGPLIEQADLDVRVEPIPAHPSVERDLAVVFDESVRWAEIESIVLRSGGPLLAKVAFVDLFRGKQVEPGKKSIAFRMTFLAPERTLTREEVDGFVGAIVQELSSSLGGRLRA